MHPLDIFILSVAALAALGSLAAARAWPGGTWLHRTWDRVEPYVGCYVRRSPATWTYAGIIFVTTWVVDGLSRRESNALLRSQSTNVANLRSHPVSVLFRSAFWSGASYVLPIVILFAVVLAPAEVWLGTARLIFVFFVGHVGTTLVTAAAISHGYFLGGDDDVIVDHAVDVGVSYGLMCVAGVLVYRLPRRWHVPAAVALVGAAALAAFVVGRTFTDFGHFVAAIIGLALYPVIHSESVARRARIPMYRPWRGLS